MANIHYVQPPWDIQRLMANRLWNTSIHKTTQLCVFEMPQWPTNCQNLGSLQRPKSPAHGSYCQHKKQKKRIKPLNNAPRKCTSPPCESISHIITGIHNWYSYQRFHISHIWNVAKWCKNDVQYRQHSATFQIEKKGVISITHQLMCLSHQGTWILRILEQIQCLTDG